MGNAINLNGSKGIRYKLNEEVATGDTWVDGKPIFAKVIHIPVGQLPNNGWEEYTFDFKNIDFIVKRDMVVLDPNRIKRYWFAHDSNLICSIDRDKSAVLVHGNGGWANQEAYITLYYTKSGGVTNLLTRIKSYLFGKKVGVIYE